MLVLSVVFLAGQQVRAVARARGLGAAIAASSTVSLSSTSSTSSTSLDFFGSTTTTTTLGQSVCGDATGDGAVSATDALAALRTAISLQSCQLCVCDVNGSGSVTSTDALIVLSVAVGQPITLQCPPC